jgi:hypothetical protein
MGCDTGDEEPIETAEIAVSKRKGLGKIYPNSQLVHLSTTQQVTTF